MSRSLLLGLALGLTPALFTAACAADPAAEAAVKPAHWPFTTIEAARFDEPWAMAFLPDGSLLVTEKAGKLVHFDPASGKRTEIAGVPQVAYGGQGGFGDVALHRDPQRHALLYRLLWRGAHDPRLWRDTLDADRVQDGVRTAVEQPGK